MVVAFLAFSVLTVFCALVALGVEGRYPGLRLHLRFIAWAPALLCLLAAALSWALWSLE